MNVYILFLTFILFNLVSGCTIEVLVKSNTAKSVFAQFTSPDGQKSPLWLFKKPTQNHRFQIKMDDCSKSPMVLETFEYNPVNGEKGKLIYSSKAFVNGNGYVDYIITGDLQGKIAGRVGVLCGFGECGGRGKREVTRADRR